MNNVTHFPPPLEEPPCYAAIDEDVEIDPIEDLAQMMGWRHQDVMLAIDNQSWAKGLAGKEESYREGYIVDGSNYELDLNDDLSVIRNHLYMVSFDSLEESRVFFERTRLVAGVVIDPANENQLVIANQDTVLTEMCGGRVVLNLEEIPTLVNLLIRRKRAHDNYDPENIFKASNIQRVEWMKDRVEGMQGLDWLSHLGYLDGAVEAAKTMQQFPVVGNLITCPDPSLCVSEDRRSEVRGRDWGLRAYPNRFESEIKGGGFQAEAEDLWPEWFKADSIAELREAAFVFRYLTGKDPLPLMKTMFMLKLGDLLASHDLVIPMAYTKLIDPGMRTQVDDMKRIEGRSKSEILNQMVAEMFEGFLNSAIREVVQDASALAGELTEQGVDERIAGRLVATEADFMIQRRQRALMREQEQRYAQVVAFMKAYPDPTVFVDEIMGAVEG